MLLPKRELAAVLSGDRRTVLLPRLPDPTVRHRLKRPGGRLTETRFVVTDVREVQLDDLTDQDARRYGYDTVLEWRDEWLRAHANVPKVSWTLSVAYEATLQRVPEREEVRLLARQHGARFQDGPDAAHAGQYTATGSRALDREPEAVDPDTIDRFSLENRQRTMKRVAQMDAQYARMPMWQRLRLIEEDARMSSVARGHLRVIQQRLDRSFRQAALGREPTGDEQQEGTDDA
jgi:hypothetical protein